MITKQYFLEIQPVTKPVAKQILSEEPLTESQQELIQFDIEFNKRQTELVLDLIERCNVDVRIKKILIDPYSAIYYIFLIGDLDNLTYIATEIKPFINSYQLDFKNLE